MRVKTKIRYKFLFISVLIAITMGFFAHYIVENQFKLYVLGTYKDGASSYLNSLSRECFDSSSSKNLKEAGDVESFAKRIKENNEISNLIITDANGTIIYADNKTLLNTGLLDDPSWQDAITGIKLITETGLDENIKSIYIPLTVEDQNIRGVVIYASDLSAETRSIDELTGIVMLSVVSVSALFILIAYLIMYEMESRMNEQQRSISDKSKALIEERQLYEAITTSIAESLIVINAEGQIILFNPEAEKLTGHRSDDVEYRSYKNILTLYDDEGKKMKEDLIGQSLKTGKIIRTTSKDGFCIKNNGLIPVAINIAPVAEGKSFIRGVAVTIEDITTEKELQKVKDEFVYVVAHELGNPIFALDGYLGMLEDKNKKCDAPTKELLANAKGINNQLSILVNDLLEVSRNETGRLTFDLEKINLKEIVNEVIKNESFKAKEKKIKISAAGTSFPLVLGNEHKIKEVLTNLVNNAIKYTPQNGEVAISFKRDSKHVTTSIKDNGIGLSNENQKQLFEKFFRVKNKATEGISGTGLGLFISKQIVEKCGGQIWAESQEHKGSTFSFTLKIAKK